MPLGWRIEPRVEPGHSQAVKLMLAAGASTTSLDRKADVDRNYDSCGDQIYDIVRRVVLGMWADRSLAILHAPQARSKDSQA